MSSVRRVSQVAGVGLHTGRHAVVDLFPAPPGTGIVFRTGETEIAARAENVVDTTRCTVLGKESVRVSTVEHFLSACAGLGVSDLIAEVSGPEMPIDDGSAQIWADVLLQAGIGEIEEARFAPPVSVLREPVIVPGKNGAFVAAYPSDSLRVTVCAAFEHPLVGTQIARFVGGDEYIADIAPARTFGFIEEIEALQKAGLALGGSLDNALVVYPDHYSRPLRFPNELARHKLLDVLGDLNLAFGGAGVPIADIIAVKPSHTLNVEAARQIAAQSAPVVKE